MANPLEGLTLLQLRRHAEIAADDLEAAVRVDPGSPEVARRFQVAQWFGEALYDRQLEVDATVEQFAAELDVGL
jgi:hypothetical protein